jgi:hypothetical protein
MKSKVSGTTHLLKSIAAAGFAILAIATAARSNATEIVAIADSNIGYGNDQFFHNLFNGQTVFGRTSGNDWTLTNWDSSIVSNGGSLTTGALSAGALVGKNWVALSTNDAFSTSDLSILANYAAGGGNIVVIGEGPAYTAENTNANAVLAALGSQMSFSYTSSAVPPWTIAADPLTAGVTTFNSAYAGGITLSGGTALVTGSGGVVLAAVDRNSASSSVPDSGTTAALLGGALLGLAALRRRSVRA